MKIKINGTWGSISNGEIVDAIVTYDKHQAMFYDRNSYTYYTLYIGQFEIVEEEKDMPKTIGNSIRDWLGQDIKIIEFK